MLSYSQFIEEQRKAGKLSSFLATLALAVHGGIQAYRQATDPGYIARHVNRIYNPSLETHVGPEELANYLENLHPVVKPKPKAKTKAKPRQEEKTQNENTETPT